MKRLFAVTVIGSVAALLLCAAPTTAAEPVDLVSNGGFEDGLAEWTPDVKHSLVTEAGQARSGRACISGEVTEPNKALFLKQQVPVKPGNRYQFEVWARATNRTKLVLWYQQPGSTGRELAASWDKLTRQWRRYSTALIVRAEGVLELQLVAPSSHAAPPGQIWLDDVALYETEMPPVMSVSKDLGFNDEPAMATADDGSIYVAWNSFRDGDDSLQVARFQSSGKSLQSIGEWQVAGGPKTYVLGARAVGADENVVVAYAAEKDKNWDIHAVTCGPDGPGRPVAVSSDAAVDVKPSAAWQNGTLWVAWESNRNGCRQIFAASISGDRVSKPQAVSEPDASCYDPSVVVLANGQVCVGWHSFRDNNYDVYLRRRSTDGSWQPPARLTKAPTIDRHAVLFTRNDELWLVYENTQTTAYNIGRTNSRRLVVAKVTSEGLMAPVSATAPSPLDGRCEGPSAAFDTAGRLWLTMLKPRLPRSGWDVFVTCFAGGRWEQPTAISADKGMDRRPCLALADGRAIVAFQADNTPNSWSDLDQMENASSNVLLAGVNTGPAPADTAIKLEPLAESEELFEPAEIRVQRGEDMPTPSIEYKGKQLKLFFGDLHEHTEISVCNRLGDQSINESYQHMRDIARHDFACVTDHGYNINPYLWGYTAKQARVHDDQGRFLTFLAEEWTSSFEEYSEKHPYGFYGHHNLILADSYFPRWWNSRNRQTPADVWEDLRKMNANFAVIPHQIADTGNVPTDWNYVDEVAQPVAEIFQTRGSYEYKGAPREAGRSTPEPGYFIQDAWARGIVIGVIASPDHGGGYGKACVYAPELTREAILDAIRARHCYGTSAAKIVLDVRVDGHLMGEKITKPAPQSVDVEIRVRCPADIDRVEVCRNNRFIYTHSPQGTEAELTFVDREPLEGRSYYYVRVIQKDEEIAWSSPVWFGAE